MKKKMIHALNQKQANQSFWAAYKKTVHTWVFQLGSIVAQGQRRRSDMLDAKQSWELALRAAIFNEAWSSKLSTNVFAEVILVRGPIEQTSGTLQSGHTVEKGLGATYNYFLRLPWCMHCYRCFCLFIALCLVECWRHDWSSKRLDDSRANIVFCMLCFCIVFCMSAGYDPSPSRPAKRKRTNEESRFLHACLGLCGASIICCWWAAAGIDLAEVNQRQKQMRELDTILLDAMTEGFDTGVSCLHGHVWKVKVWSCFSWLQVCAHVLRLIQQGMLYLWASSLIGCLHLGVAVPSGLDQLSFTNGCGTLVWAVQTDVR